MQCIYVVHTHTHTHTHTLWPPLSSSTRYIFHPSICRYTFFPCSFRNVRIHTTQIHEVRPNAMPLYLPRLSAPHSMSPNTTSPQTFSPQDSRQSSFRFRTSTLPSPAGKQIFGEYRGHKSSFTTSFRSGSYRDTSLGSLKRLRLTAKRNEEAARQRLLKFSRLREELSRKRERTRKEREERRRVHNIQNSAAAIIQRNAHVFLRYLRERNRVLRRDRERASLHLIQAWIRGFLSRKYARRHRKELSAACIFLQRFVRCYLKIRAAKNELKRRRLARQKLRNDFIDAYYAKRASAIQRQVRGRQARKYVEQLRASRKALEENERIRLEQRRQKAMKKAEDAARRSRANASRYLK